MVRATTTFLQAMWTEMALTKLSKAIAPLIMMENSSTGSVMATETRFTLAI